jgi:hypothetical protein
MAQSNVNDFIGELNGGVLTEKLAHQLSESALATIHHGNGKKTAKVTLELTLKQIGDNEQVMVQHKLSHTTPTKRGKKSEEDVTETPMFVGRGGVMTVNPPKEDNNGQFGLKQEKDGPSGSVSSIR